MSDVHRQFEPKPRWHDASEKHLLDYGETLDSFIDT